MYSQKKGGGAGTQQYFICSDTHTEGGHCQGASHPQWFFYISLNVGEMAPQFTWSCKPWEIMVSIVEDEGQEINLHKRLPRAESGSCPIIPLLCWKWHPVIFSTCYFLRSTLSARAVLTTLSARAVLATLSARTVVTFQHGAIWLVLPTTFSARSHLIGTVSARTPLIGGQFCDFQHEAFSFVGIIATHHDNTGCVQQQQWYFTYSKGNAI